ncbi:Uncharacterised protein [Klebsiella pneumoniae]|nr:Uncharacterised protein [Klebsiella pneumoniae]
MAFGMTCQRPNVNRNSSSAVSPIACSMIASCSRARVIASWRSAIGVVPACADIPWQVIWYQRTPWIPLTTASGTRRLSSTGPCSMCNSTKQAISRSGRNGMAAKRAWWSASASRNETPSTPIAPRWSDNLAGSTKVLEPIAPGAKRLPSSLVQITTSTGRSVTTRASLSAFRHASPAITP